MYLGLVLKTSAAKAALFPSSALREKPHPAVSGTALSGSLFCRAKARFARAACA